MDIAGAKVAGETKGEKEVKNSEERMLLFTLIPSLGEATIHAHTKSR
jgi:hypothetical protein